MCRKLTDSGIRLEYIETNAFWAEESKNEKEILEKLKNLLQSWTRIIMMKR